MANFASRLVTMHGHCIATFGVTADEDALYVWHSGAQIPCYEPSGNRARTLTEAALLIDGQRVFHCTKADFTTVPQPGDDITMGTVQATAQALRIENVETTAIRPFYRLTCMDPNLAETAE